MPGSSSQGCAIGVAQQRALRANVCLFCCTARSGSYTAHAKHSISIYQARANSPLAYFDNISICLTSRNALTHTPILSARSTILQPRYLHASCLKRQHWHQRLMVDTTLQIKKSHTCTTALVSPSCPFSAHSIQKCSSPLLLAQ